MGDAIYSIARDEILDEIVALVTDKRWGRAREMLALGLGKMKNPEAVKVLIDLLDDEDVAGHALEALAKLKADMPIKKIKPFLEHEHAWIRRVAKRIVTRLEKK